jgi:WD40 repeat protein
VVVVAIAPDGSWLATGSDDGTARIWITEGITPPPR